MGATGSWVLIEPIDLPPSPVAMGLPSHRHILLSLSVLSHIVLLPTIYSHILLFSTVVSPTALFHTVCNWSLLFSIAPSHGLLFKQSAGELFSIAPFHIFLFSSVPNWKWYSSCCSKPHFAAFISLNLYSLFLTISRFALSFTSVPFIFQFSDRFACHRASSLDGSISLCHPKSIHWWRVSWTSCPLFYNIIKFKIIDALHPWKETDETAEKRCHSTLWMLGECSVWTLSAIA